MSHRTQTPSTDERSGRPSKNQLLIVMSVLYGSTPIWKAENLRNSVSKESASEDTSIKTSLQLALSMSHRTQSPSTDERSGRPSKNQLLIEMSVLYGSTPF